MAFSTLTLQYSDTVSLVFHQPYTGMIFTDACCTAGIFCWRPYFGRQLGRNDQSHIWPSTCKLFIFSKYFLIVCYFLHQLSLWLCSASIQSIFLWKPSSYICMIVILTPTDCSPTNTLTLAGFLLVHLTLSYLIYTHACTIAQWLQSEHSFLSSWRVLPNTPPSWCVITQETT